VVLSVSFDFYADWTSQMWTSWIPQGQSFAEIAIKVILRLVVMMVGLVLMPSMVMISDSGTDASGFVSMFMMIQAFVLFLSGLTGSLTLFMLFMASLFSFFLTDFFGTVFGGNEGFLNFRSERLLLATFLTINIVFFALILVGPRALVSPRGSLVDQEAQELDNATDKISLVAI
jgi:hypothetical protein